VEERAVHVPDLVAEVSCRITGVKAAEDVRVLPA
jgi:hypothetical protein